MWRRPEDPRQRGRVSQDGVHGLPGHGVIEVVEPAVELALDLERSVVHRVCLRPDHEYERRHYARYPVHLTNVVLLTRGLRLSEQKRRLGPGLHVRHSLRTAPV